MESRLSSVTDWPALARTSKYNCESLASGCLVSKRQLERFFRVTFSQTPKRWMHSLRMQIARDMIEHGFSTKAVADELCYKGCPQFCRAFKKYFRHPPQFYALARMSRLAKNVASGTSLPVASGGYHASTSSASNLKIQPMKKIALTLLGFATFLNLASSAITLGPVGDSYVEEGAPNSNFGTDIVIKMKRTGGHVNRDGYLMFDLTGIGSNGLATLRLNAKMADPVVGDLGVYPVTNTNWDEGTITWNNRPSLGTMIANVTNVTSSYQWFDFNVASYVDSELTSSKTLISFGLHKTTFQDSVLNVRPRETFYVPQLVLSEVFVTTGSLGTGRDSHRAVLLGNGKVLAVGGGNASYLSNAELYSPTTGLWTNAASMSVARGFFAATLLANGKVLVSGGSSGSVLSSAEIYDPATDTWTNAASMNNARWGHTATLLQNGKVLVVGGFNLGAPLTAEVYDATNNTWTSTPALANSRYYHTATLLTNGTVLVTGNSATAEIYTPANGTWTNTASLSVSRIVHTATLLSNGKVLVAGGENGGTVHASAELYDPVQRTWTNAASLNIAREIHTATLLSSGKVLVAGGDDGTSGYLASAELYDPSNDTWSTTGTLNQSRSYHTATLLSGGAVLLVGGDSTSVVLNSAEYYAP